MVRGVELARVVVEQQARVGGEHVAAAVLRHLVAAAVVEAAQPLGADVQQAAVRQPVAAVEAEVLQGGGPLVEAS